MLVIISQKPLLTHYLMGFRRLAESGKVSIRAGSKGHKDGWGIVHINGEPEYLGHKALFEDGSVEANANTSVVYDRVCNEIEDKQLNGIFLIHLRRASLGKKVLENTAPFIAGGWVFSHNGTVSGLNKGDQSDSRMLFKMLTEEIFHHNNAEEGIRSVVKKIRESKANEYTSLTFLLSDGESLFAYREYSDQQDAEYYSLKYALIDDSTLIFSQENFIEADWRTIPNRTLVIAGKEPKIKKKISIN